MSSAVLLAACGEGAGSPPDGSTGPDGGTAISQEGSFEFRGLWRLGEPLLGAEMRKGEEKELQRLKAVIEAA